MEPPSQQQAVRLPTTIANGGQGNLPLLLALLAAVGPISTDMYLPAFPAMRADLHGGASSAALTLAAWFVGIAVGQLVHGPLSDRLGRRAPLLLGIALYVLASAGCSLSSGMPELIGFRALAAFGGAAGLVVPRAIIRDVAISGEHAARIVSQYQLVVAIVPMLAPTVGGLIVQLADWRAVFWATVAYGVVCLVLTQRFLGETLARSARRRSSVGTILAHYVVALQDRFFASHALTGSMATFSLFAFLGAAPAVFLRHFGMTPTLFGATFIANGAGYAIGTYLNVLAIRTFGRPRVLTIATLALLAFSAAMLLCAATGTGGLWGVEVPVVLVMLTLGCLLPDAAIGALMPGAADAGIASALYGTMVFSIGALGAVAAGWIEDGDPKSMAALLVAGAVLTIGSSLLRPPDREAALRAGATEEGGDVGAPRL